MTIPSPSTDPALLMDDLRTRGVAIRDAAFSADQIQEARQCLDALAARERDEGVAVMEDGSAADGAYRPGPNQRIVSLIGKDAVFARMATEPELLAAARAALSSGYDYPDEVIGAYGFDRVMLSSVTANIANPGGMEMGLHHDQGFVPPSTPFPVLVNVIVPLVDFTEANGATRVVVGSHLTDPRQLHGDHPDAEPVEAAAGAAILIDGRTWHGTGANLTGDARPAVLLTYCMPWVRPFANHGVDLDDRVLVDAPDDLLELLGFTPWLVFGHDEARRLSAIRTG